VRDQNPGGLDLDMDAVAWYVRFSFVAEVQNTRWMII
jgi:hypothetical protein